MIIMNTSVEEVAKQIALEQSTRKYSHSKMPTSSSGITEKKFSQNVKTNIDEEELKSAVAAILPRKESEEEIEDMNESSPGKKDELDLSYSSIEDEAENIQKVIVEENEKKNAVEYLTEYCKSQYKPDGLTKRKLFKIFEATCEFFKD